MSTVLVANRGEIAVRVIATAQALGHRAVAVHSADDATSLHVSAADLAIELPGTGPAAYLDIAALTAAIEEAGADIVHPGYGFLAESAAFARACAAAGAAFAGPSPEALEATGDKARTAALARELGIPLGASTPVLDGADGARELLAASPQGIALKAVAGGGGRGIAVVTEPGELEAAFARCAAEARAGFGDDRVFAEEWFAGARHIEVQCAGLGDGRVVAVGDRDCSLQRRRQKVIEIAPAPGLDPGLRARLWEAAERLLAALDYASLATVEFLVAGDRWVLLEVNPRIQVEHTVTEEVTGLDLVAVQLALASGEPVDLPRGDPGGVPGRFAVEARVGAEALRADGAVEPAVGRVEGLELPFGPGVRVDSWLRPGTQVGALYDSLLAKVTVSGADLAGAVRALTGALARTRIRGVDTTLPLLRAILAAGLAGEATTTALDERLGELLEAAAGIAADAEPGDRGRPDGEPGGASGPGPDGQPASASGAGGSGEPESGAALPEPGPGEEYVRAPLTGTVIALGEGSELAVIEAMKMHHPVTAPPHARARALVAVGQTVRAGEPLFLIETAEPGAGAVDAEAAAEHPGIAEARERHAGTGDEARPEAVAKVHARGRRTARENLADLVVAGTFVEYGPLAIAAQRARRSRADLIARTPGDGLVGGIGRIATPAGEVEAVVMSYDYMVLAGTQGARNHAKTDRLIHVARERGLPIVLFAEGGGGRPGDTDIPPGAQLDVTTFAALAGLRGRVPLVAIVSGRCFAGNAALAGVCDVIIATEDANIGMGGPAMIEGGGLGRFAPEDVGPAALHARTGAIDVLAADDAAAVARAREYLGFAAGGRAAEGSAPNRGAVDGGAAGAGAPAAGTREAEALESEGPAAGAPEAGDAGAADCQGARPDPRTLVPADRLRAFDMRELIAAVADPATVFELRADHADGAIVGFARVQGRPFGFIANANRHQGGAIDVDAARSFTAHLRLVQALGLPLVSFVDTPGFMVGPQAEEEPGVRVFGELFAAGAALTVPVGAIIVRKAYGLGAMAMTAGHLRATQFTVAWPSGEMGPMGLEGAVRLGFAKELAAIADADEREAAFRERLDALYEQGRAMSAAEVFDVDDVIDPADTARWIATLG
ncbi:carbamoyl-phosphate-synthetase [Brevibacterium sp. BRM-1]|uniref:acetyl-CoA carboxylase family protein n=1 Tax=Brevibacterium sp. BRM-1 TaxID=2999062 RepID=UPI002281E8A5|nr:carboxyl transferase domain-containing protein [Brevibacterium sp. BRM-1]WAL41133.1 carbamoyl-phosphate-synthetase [Brevibacterium sp. BRM-1]